ncbi:Predicted oxidoreductase [Amycolatopsis arida]|uniref:Predicted oxidoreductase n=1 Tax=Amycolatopsis arida TaxID=587909 RepID=A0A1I5ZI60_9PSEU|nr:aldo/keto reductase [Amycolatopsis arida]TDX89678.1 aryl-alcohol dehydrogenase-like predicted oxidoreductase [Amycolatopsis arida]SFQ55827.1 Predicted oxidoreductase [Amycolatopsis arida]
MTTTQLARIAVGLAALGRPAYINERRLEALPADRGVPAMRARTHEVLDAAYAAGVRRFDAARSYGRAEEFLAGWLAERGHRDVIVSSKWGYAYVGGWRLDAAVHEEKEHSARRFRAQWRESRHLLGDAISLYQVHSLTPDSPLFTDGELLAELAALADSGVRVGFSTSGPHQTDTITRALDLEVSGRRVFTAVQSTWNVLERSAETALADAHAAGVLVQLKETLANGRLAVRPPAPLAERAAARNLPAATLAIAAALARPWADVVLVGPVSVAQLRGNLAAADRAADLVDADPPVPAEPPEQYWAQRGTLDWH